MRFVSVSVASLSDPRIGAWAGLVHGKKVGTAVADVDEHRVDATSTLRSFNVQ